MKRGELWLTVIGLLLCVWMAPMQAAPVLQSFATTVAGRSVRGVKVRLDSVRLKIGVGNGQVGKTESLAGIARRYGALVALNGAFGEYTQESRQNAVHSLATDGRVIHLGNIGTMLYFDDQNRGRMARVPLSITGTLGESDSWYAYWINSRPTRSAIIVYTPDWGPSTEIPGGVQVVVSKGVITRVGSGSQAIPRDGFVILFHQMQEMNGRFQVGQRCTCQVRPETPPEGWETMREALGCGPRLVTNGQITLDAVAEGFRDPKVLKLSWARSAVGLTHDGWLILATSSGTMAQLARVMQALGACDAMNLDGGASSGLWVQGRYVTSPGRPLTNALLVLPRSLSQAKSNPEPKPSVGNSSFIQLGEIALSGSVVSINVDSKKLVMKATSFTLPNGKSAVLATAKEKTVLIGKETLIHAPVKATQIALGDLKMGDTVTVVGPDAGSGKNLAAREIVGGAK